MTRILLGLIALLPFFSCEKDNEQDPELKGRWNVENFIEKEYDNGILVNTVVEPGGGIVYDFRESGQLVISEPGQPDISWPYTIISADSVDIASQRLEIQNLTSSSVTLFARQPLGPTGHEEAYINLKR